ncbi:MAG: sulfotransferase [Gemmatimonadota bacterium]|nr:sulfotransferase [Gemmatimonadota bacterium]
MTPNESTTAHVLRLERDDPPHEASPPKVRIEAVERLGGDGPRLRAAAIDRPGVGDEWPGTSLPIAGWALGTGVPAVAVDFVHEGRVIRKTPLAMRREDVVARFEGEPIRPRCGFRASVGMLGLPSPCDLDVRVVFDDGSIEPLARVRATHTPLPPTSVSRWTPLALTTLGRTGSTWLMRLLREHPQIAVHGGYPYETRAAAYWLHMVGVLASPANTLQSSHPDAFPDDLWTIGHHPFNGESLAPESSLRRWFAAGYPAHVAELARVSIDDFYDRVTEDLGKPGATRFAEKLTPGQVPRLMWEIYPAAGEIILVRDFRDMACSILAFNEKRGFVAFGRENVDSDARFIADNLASGANALLAAWRERSDRARLVRYEDLVLDPVPTLAALYEGLGLASDPDLVRDSVARASGREGAMERHRTSRNPAASIGRWRDELDPGLVDVCRTAFGEALEAFGYDLE